MSLVSQKIEELALDLVNKGALTKDQLAVAKESQKNLGGDLGEILIKRGFVSEEDLFKNLGKKFGFSVISLATYKPDKMALSLISTEEARRWKVLPLFEVEDKLTVVTADPFNLTVLDELRALLHREIGYVFASPTEIEKALDQYYPAKFSKTNDALVEIVESKTDELDTRSPLRQLEKEAQAASIVSTVNQIFKQAFQERASDIHLEPVRGSFRVRLRIDGILEEIRSLPSSMQQPVTSRVKIIGGMDVAEQRLPQDGRARVKIEGHEIDLRIATYPTQFGETTTVRLLSKENLITLDDLGLLAADRTILEDMILRPHGIFLVTGPTGSGKTTTLYAALQKVNHKDKNILSIEDPIENEIPGVNQTGVNVKAGVTFASAIRAMLRQDPDIIMVGEIRDQETADIAMRAAMTGHFVFSSLHTNSAVGAITRLLDLNIEPYLISSSLSGVMAQRLVRRICSKCKKEGEVSAQQAKELGIAPATFKVFVGQGCQHCRMTGYKGRIGIFELFVVDDVLRGKISQKVPENLVQQKLAESSGYHTMLKDGVDKIKQGVTTVEEVLRVVVEV